MAQANLKAFVPDLPPSGRRIRQRVLVGGNPAASKVVEVQLGKRPDRRDFLTSRCFAKRKGFGDQCGRFPIAGRCVCHVHGGGSPRRQREGRAMVPEVSGAIGAAIRDVRQGRLQLDDVARFFPQLQEAVEHYRQDPARLDLREDAIDLTVLKDLLMSGAIPASTGVLSQSSPIRRRERSPN